MVALNHWELLILRLQSRTSDLLLLAHTAAHCTAHCTACYTALSTVLKEPLDRVVKHLEAQDGTKNDCGDVPVTKSLRFYAAASLCKDGGVHSR